METFEKHLFDELLNQAVSRLNERIVQRCQGEGGALEMLKSDSEGEGVWLSQFVDNFLKESLLDTTAGAAFILQCLERRKLSGEFNGTVGSVMQDMARQVFAELVRKKSIESLERAIAFGGA